MKVFETLNQLFQDVDCDLLIEHHLIWH